MTAAEWTKRLQRGDLCFEMWHEVIADLVFRESEAEALGWGCDYWREQAEKAEAKERRTMEVSKSLCDHCAAKLQQDSVYQQRDDLRRKLASASLANAVLREALKECRKQATRVDMGWAMRRIVEILDDALALPIDGLAEEVEK